MRPRPLVGVFPVAAQSARRELFAVLAKAFPVRFVARRPGERRGLDAAIVFGSEEGAGDMGMPCLVFPGDAGGREGSGQIEFAHRGEVDSRLRGQRLAEHRLCQLGELPVQRADVVLAVCQGAPVWVQRGNRQALWTAAMAPHELQSGEGLRDHLRAGRFLALLPLVDFLRHLVGEREREPARLRACFVIDDPNLHATRYGYIRYPELLAHARRHGYHVAMASIPLDYWRAHQRAVALFRDGSHHLSLAVHGNNHEHSELRRFPDDAAALATAAQALRRAEALEQRTGLDISRVMCAPHEEWSRRTVQALFRVGFEALVLDPRGERSAATRTGPLGGWAPAQLLDGGLPVLPRYGLPVDEDLVFRAYLDLPLIFYGHHQDLADGLDVLAEIAGRVGRLGEARWMSLQEIARTNRHVRREGAAEIVRLYSRKTTVQLPPDTRELVVEVPPSSTEADVVLRCGSQETDVHLESSGATEVVFGGHLGASVDLAMSPTEPRPVADVPRPRAGLRPWARRLLTEARDQSAPIRRRTASAVRRG